MNRLATATLLALTLFVSSPAAAEQIKAFVGEFTVSPAENAGLKGILQTLLSTRLNGDGIVTVGTAAGADVVVTGSYTQIGKIFSIDAAVRADKGEVIASTYEQGESQDALIPAVGKVAARLRSEILKQRPPRSASPAEVRVAVAPAPPAVPTSEWISPRIDGAKTGLAPGSGGETAEFVIAQKDLIQLYRRDAGLIPLAEEKIPSRMKIVSLDTLPAEEGGGALAFLSIVDSDRAASRIYLQQEGKLKLVAENLPFLFRVVAADGKRALFAQEMGRGEDFYGPVFAAAYGKGELQRKDALHLAAPVNVFNFNRFTDRQGKPHLIAFTENGKLSVFSEKGDEIWQSSEKYGGSETFFERPDPENERITGNPYRKRFIPQRIVVTERGEIIVSHNSGTVIGNSRNYSSYSLVSLTWNGSALEEQWRSKPVQNYLADYYYVPDSRELVLLEVVQKEGFFGKGGSAVRTVRLP